MSSLQQHRIPGIYFQGKKIYIQNMFPGKTFFKEKIIQVKGKEYREFNPRRSKLAAAIKKGYSFINLKKENIILYLGVSHGYTASFLSDLIAPQGLIFGVDFSPRVMRDLVLLAKKRKNIVPLLANANFPETYFDKVCLVDFVYQDLAQKNQTEIFINNCNLFLKKGGCGLLMIKARSIDITKKPSLIFQEERKKLEKEYLILDFRTLEPFELDHCLIMIKKTKVNS